jgi:hypothetical protein
MDEGPLHYRWNSLENVVEVSEPSGDDYSFYCTDVVTFIKDYFPDKQHQFRTWRKLRRYERRNKSNNT